MFYAPSQLDVEFTNKTDDPKKYDNIKKVYSIWIVINPPQYLAGTIKKKGIAKKAVNELRQAKQYYKERKVDSAKKQKECFEKAKKELEKI